MYKTLAKAPIPVHVEISKAVAVTKYGFEKCMNFIKLQQTVPCVYSHTQRIKYLRESPHFIEELYDVFPPDTPQHTSNLTIIGPPSGFCLQCNKTLETHNKPA